MSLEKLINGGLIIFLLAYLFTSCEYEKLEPISEDDIPEVVSFSEHIIPIFESNCTQCHNGSVPPDLSAENAYFELSQGGYLNTDDPESSELYVKIVGNGSMAQYATDLNRAFILRWIEQGAEEN